MLQGADHPENFETEHPMCYNGRTTTCLQKAMVR